MAKQRASVQKRQREFQKREREQRKREKAVLKRERRDARDSAAGDGPPYEPVVIPDGASDQPAVGDD